MKNILVVDDSKTNRTITKDALCDIYDVRTVSSGKEALKFLQQGAETDLVLLDYIMPEMNGLEVLRIMKAHPKWKQIPVIILTSNKDVELESDCLDMGAADFIGKPFARKTLLGRVARTMELEDFRKNMEQKIQEKTQAIKNIQRNVVINLANIIECRDSDSGHHVRRTGAYVDVVARGLQNEGIYTEILTDEYVEKLVQAAALHDIGKIAVPDSILNKPGKLTPAEFEVIKGHTVVGGELARESLKGIEADDYLEIVEDIAVYHHERWDGKGYPEHLKRQEIPLCARIMAIGDVFDALISRRCYKKAYPLDEAFEIIKESRGKHFDPMITDIFLLHREDIEEITRKFADNGQVIA